MAARESLIRHLQDLNRACGSVADFASRLPTSEARAIEGQIGAFEIETAALSRQSMQVRGQIEAQKALGVAIRNAGKSARANAGAHGAGFFDSFAGGKTTNNNSSNREPPPPRVEARKALNASANARDVPKAPAAATPASDASNIVESLPDDLKEEILFSL